MIRIGVRSFVSAGGVPTDADAQAFIDAAGITDATQQSAINTLVLDLKGYSIWDKMKAIYPFVGGTATTHKWNLKDPRDLDAAFRLVFNGGWTHSSNGALPNGTNAYAETYYNPSTSGQLNSAHLCYYSRTNINSSGAIMGGNPTSGTVYRHYLGQGNSFIALNSTSEGNYNPSSYSGMHVTKRENSTETKQVYNGSVITTSTIASSQRPNVTLFLAARRNGASAANYTALQCAFASIGDGLTDSEAANFYTAVQAYQTTLSRNV